MTDPLLRRSSSPAGGTFGGPGPTIYFMDCHLCRETLSARMDGEVNALDSVEVDAHLSTCSACRGWQQAALRLTRTLRVRPAVPTPDLTAAILAAAAAQRPAPAPAGVSSSRQIWRWLLGLVALVQASVGLSELLGISRMGMRMSSDSEHLFNESTAWNVALGVGFAVAAVWPRLANGLLPTLGVFLAVLVGVSVIDLINGAADLTRVGSHVVVLLGMALLVMVHRGYARNPGPRQRATGSPRVAVSAESMPDLRVGGATTQRRGLRPAGRHAA